MTGRERVLATLNREPVDRVAMDIGGTDCSSIHVIAYDRLRRRLGLSTGPIRCGCLTQLVAEPDEDMNRALGTDVEAFWFRPVRTKIWQTPFGLELLVPEGFAVEDLADGSSVVRGGGGVVTARRAANAYYFDPALAPLAEVRRAEEVAEHAELFERWDWPAAYDEPLEALARRARAQYEGTDRAVVALWNMHYLQAGLLLRGFERFFMDLVSEPELVAAILERLHAAYMRRAEAFLEAFGEWIDAVFLTDDLGTQQGPLISPRLYRQVIFPYTAELVGRIKAAGKKVIMHSCGAVAEFIPAMVEMGVDALNPVQVAARGMNPRELAGRYGDKIAFWGGGCDTQGALCASDPAVVRADVARRLDEYGPRAHLVFTQVHNVQYDVPPENVLAMRDEFLRWTRGV